MNRLRVDRVHSCLGRLEATALLPSPKTYLLMRVNSFRLALAF